MNPRSGQGSMAAGGKTRRRRQYGTAGRSWVPGAVERRGHELRGLYGNDGKGPGRDGAGAVGHELWGVDGNDSEEPRRDGAGGSEARAAGCG
jgi:hypothetical protein